MVTDKFNRISSFVDIGRTKACKRMIWFGVPHLMPKVPSQITGLLGQLSMRLLGLHHSTLKGRKESVFPVYFLQTVIHKFNLDSSFVRGRRATACKQKFWFEISRFMRETSNQKVCLPGPQPDLTVALTSFHTRGQHTHQINEGCFAAYFLTGGSWLTEADFIVRWEKENQSVRASDLVWNCTFNARSSKPHCLLASIERPSMWPLDLKGKNIECFCGVLSTDGRWQSQIDTPCIGGRRATACEQKFWFGISRFMRETPNHILCSLGLPAKW